MSTADHDASDVPEWVTTTPRAQLENTTYNGMVTVYPADAAGTALLTQWLSIDTGHLFTQEEMR